MAIIYIVIFMQFRDFFNNKKNLKNSKAINYQVFGSLFEFYLSEIFKISIRVEEINVLKIESKIFV